MIQDYGTTRTLKDKPGEAHIPDLTNSSDEEIK